MKRKTNKQRDLETTIQHRSNTVDFKIDKEKRTLTFPYGSEEPVNRGYLGYEILDFTEESVDQSRLMASAPLLYNHNSDDIIGVVEKSWIDNKRGYVTVRLGKHERGEEILGLINDGILRNVSMGYSVTKTQKEERKSDPDKEYYRVVGFEVAEVSIVTIPADYKQAGIGRSKEATETPEKVANKATMEEECKSATLEEQRSNAVADQTAPQSNPIPEKIMATSTNDTDVVRDLEKARNDASTKERNRTKEIISFCNKMQLGEETLSTLLDDPNADINTARKIYIDKLPANEIAPIQQRADIPEKDLEDINISAGIAAALKGDWSSREAGLVREVSRELELKGKKRTASDSFLVPFEAFKIQKRATMQTGTANVGGNLVGVEYRPQDLIEYLYNTSIAFEAGVSTLDGLVSDITIPKVTGTSTGYWLSSETSAVTFSNMTFGQISMTPKTLGNIQKFSRQMILQGEPAIEQIVRRNIAKQLRLDMDSAILKGGGSGEPTGILETSGINSIAMGTNGGAITIDKLIDLETAVKIDNGNIDGATTKYVTNGKVVGDLKKLKDSAGQYLYNVGNVVAGRGATPASINGYTILDSMNVPSNLTKGSSSGNCSALIFGDFADCLVGFWGGIEIVTGESQDDFEKALTSVRGLITMDVAVQNPVSFGAISDITTTN
nr:phage major capsid protein [uncultured Mediterranean phage uvMED]BAR26803.1 phage major capsid protein [uncultured Mediterranean phage uvMED]